MAKIGRPTKYSQELANKICSKLAQGISLRTICLADDMPAASNVFNWLATKKDFQEQYARAKAQGTDAHHEMLDELGDQAIALAQEVGEKRAGAVVQAIKLKADNLKWVMSKLKPKKYGERLDMTTDGEKISFNVVEYAKRKDDNNTI